MRLKRFAGSATFVLLACMAAMLIVWQLRLAADVFPDEELAYQGSMRRFRLVVPHRLSEPAPIVFAFHGVGDSTDAMAEYSRLDRLAAAEGFLLVYPAARKGMWATMENAERPLDANPDVQFFDRLLEHLGKRFEVDRRRIYVVGMSNGGAFVQLLTAARPEVIAAAAAHSGGRPRDLEPEGALPPLLLLVGEDDFALSAMRADADAYRAGGREVEFIAIPGLGHAWSPSRNRRIWSFLSRHAAAHVVEQEAP